MKQILTLIIFLFYSLTFAQADSSKLAIKTIPNQGKASTIERVEIVNNSFDKLVAKLTEKKEEKSSIWDILIPLLIGAGLTLGTQLLIEVWKTKKEKTIKTQELISRGRAKTYLIAQVLKDLAMYKVHKQYYLRAFQLSNDEESFKKHYEKGQQQRETEVRLDDNIADYFQLVTEYAIIAKNIDHFQQHFQAIFHFIHPKSSKFFGCTTLTELVDELSIEEDRLNSEYERLANIFEIIQISMASRSYS